MITAVDTIQNGLFECVLYNIIIPISPLLRSISVNGINMYAGAKWICQPKKEYVLIAAPFHNFKRYFNDREKKSDNDDDRKRRERIKNERKKRKKKINNRIKTAIERIIRLKS